MRLSLTLVDETVCVDPVEEIARHCVTSGIGSAVTAATEIMNVRLAVSTYREEIPVYRPVNVSLFTDVVGPARSHRDASRYVLLTADGAGLSHATSRTETAERYNLWSGSEVAA